MTKDKAQKQAIRDRMTKTGERYTTARHFLLDLHHPQQGDATSIPFSPGEEQPRSHDSSLGEAFAASPTAIDEPALTVETALPPRVAEPGVSDAAVQKATGKSWDEWFVMLDAWGGTTHKHADIARHIAETYSIDGWWAQGVTVGYERARGMRALHERPDGFLMNASKTFPVPVERLFAAFIEHDERERWLEAVELRLRTNQPNKSARFDVLPGETRLAITFIAKGPEKATAQLQQERLADSEDVVRWKALWKEQLVLLASYLVGEPSPR